MKKIILIITILLLITGCYYKANDKTLMYQKYIDELSTVTKTSEDSVLVINIEIEKLDENLYNYRALINKSGTMKNIEAILLHNKETDDIFPSIGIFDDKITLSDDKAGVKLAGYIEEIDNIEFKLLIKYTNEENKEVKYYYVEENPTIIDK